MVGCENRKDWRYHDPKLEYQKHDYDQLTQTPAPLTAQLPVRKKTLKSKRFYNPPLSVPAAFKQPVSLSLTKNVPLRDVFVALAQQIGINIMVDPTIQGGATLYTQNQQFIDIVEELCATHGLRYRIKNNMLHIENDRPYAANYNLQFLILSRLNKNRLSVATDVFTSMHKNASDNKENNGSQTTLTTETKTDFWQELSDTLTVILTDFNPATPPKEATRPAKFTIHKQAGIIAVFGSQAQHHQVQQYFDQLRDSIERQVLIEAKIVEVNLNDEFKSGINWNFLRANYFVQAPLGDLASPGNFNETLAPQKNVFTLGGHSRKLTGALSLLNRFGTVRTLSNPRLTVINNQAAVLKVTKQKVYFRLTHTREYNYFVKREQNRYGSDIKTVPIGLMMYVHPTIREDGKIIMTLRPTISQVIQEVEDPAVSIASHNKLKSLVPEVQIRELDSILAMNSGETVVVGGLMEERSDNSQSGVPELEDAPLLGGLFKGKSNERAVTELVIFIRATIIDSDGFEAITDTSSISAADQNTYQNFTQDPRPLAF
jgi:general secretion pathway protein D